MGDAAAVLDPAASHGVPKAVMSGMMAGHVIAACVSGEGTPAAATLAYARCLAGQFEADVSALTGMYQSLPHPPVWVLPST